MKRTLIFITMLAVFLTAAGLAQAANNAQKQAAIDSGLAYLASTQTADGSWNYSYSNVPATGAALLAFVDQYYKPGGWGAADYTSVVTKATNYLLSQATTLNISSPNWWGYKGTANSGIGLQWNFAAEETYISGIVIPALARLVSNPYPPSTPYLPASTVISSSNAAVNGLTYTQVIQRAIDAFTWGQTPPSVPSRYGGWRYFTAQNDSDMSTTQWPVMDYLFAKSVPGVIVPGPGSPTATALQSWIAACQQADGGVRYQPDYAIVNATHIGGFLLSSAFAGGPGTGSVDDALTWLNAHWKEFANNDWYGNFNHPYAMWAVFKGLDSTPGIGLTDPTDVINNLLDPTQTNWWEDYCQWLVGNQNADGSWSGYDFWYGPMATAWDINILNGTRTAPLPGTLLLLGSGLLGLGVLRKRMKK
jgi:hypothetical protein